MRSFAACYVLCLSVACAFNEPSDPDGGGGSGGTGGEGTASGAGGTGGDGGSGGEASAGGSGGGVSEGGFGGEGGSPPVGPCDAIETDDLAVIFTAPPEHIDGLIAISAFVQCAPGSQAVCQNVLWTDPYVGCVAESDVDIVTCVFGSYPAGTKIHYIAGVDVGNAPTLDVWFSWFAGGEIVKIGTHLVCRGPTLVGGYDGNSFFGVLSDTDEPNRANQMILVP